MRRLARILWVALRFRLYRFWPGLARAADPRRAARLRTSMGTALLWNTTERAWRSSADSQPAWP